MLSSVHNAAVDILPHQLQYVHALRCFCQTLSVALSCPPPLSTSLVHLSLVVALVVHFPLFLSPHHLVASLQTTGSPSVVSAQQFQAEVGSPRNQLHNSTHSTPQLP